MMENGELMAEDVLPKVGIAFATLARQGGALAAQLASTRVAQGQFMTFAQEGADTVFTNGFSEGFSQLLKSIGQDIGASSDGLKGLGKIYQIFFKVVKKASEVLIPILSALFSVLGGVSEIFLELFSTNLGKVVTGVLAISLAINRLTLSTFALNGALMTMIRRLVFIPMLVLGIAHEIKALFDDDLTGLIEKYFFGGEQLGNLSEKVKEKVRDIPVAGKIFQLEERGQALRNQVFGKGNAPNSLPSSSSGKQDRGQLDINITTSDKNILSTIESNNLDTYVTSG
jgi:hypothetical protein